MQVDRHGNFVSPATWFQSPNQNARPDGCEVCLIVIHGISLPSGQFGTGYPADLFLNRLDPGAHPSFDELTELRVSAHALIDRSGHLFQFVPFTRRAWHAGLSSYRGREGCNDFSIGIELEGADDVPYEATQYRSLVRLIRAIRGAHPAIHREAIVGHSDISPGRKTDPGPKFDWRRLESLLDVSDTDHW